jgi:hypothetical protein
MIRVHKAGRVNFSVANITGSPISFPFENERKATSHYYVFGSGPRGLLCWLACEALIFSAALRVAINDDNHDFLSLVYEYRVPQAWYVGIGHPVIRTKIIVFWANGSIHPCIPGRA